MAKPLPSDKPKLWAFIGDLHVKPTGLWAADNLSARNRRQRWLMDRWGEAAAEIRALGQRHALTVAIGGDLIDKPGKAARDAALELLTPITRPSVARAVWGVVGTPYHVGEDGDEDRQVLQELGAARGHVAQQHRLIECGRRLWWAHHGVSLGANPRQGINNTARKIWEACRDYEWPRPSLVVAHHVHYSPADYGYYGGVRVAVVPCWQLPDDYASKRLTWSAPTIGYMLWWPATDVLQWRTFPIPEDLLHG